MDTCSFDVARVPFSSHGSWMSLSVPRKERRLFLRNCHGGAQDVFPLEPLLGGEPVATEMTGRPWTLELRHAGGRIEACFESTRTLRLRGEGLGLQLGDRHLVYSEAPDRAVINHRPALRRYGVEALRGRIEIRTLVPDQPVFPCVALVSPDDTGGWELAIDEFQSTWVPPERAPFDVCATGAREAFADFLDAMPPARPEDAEARALAAYVDWSCTVEPCGLIRRPTILMSKNWMTNVWSWDQCFNAMALARGRPALALDQMLTLVDHQDEFGSYPDSINDTIVHYHFSKPPVHGWALREMLARMPEPPPRDTMETLLRSLGRQAEWWLSFRMPNAGCRMPNGSSERQTSSAETAPTADPASAIRDPKSSSPHSASGLRHSALPYYLHGNDSGWDNSTMFGRGVPLVAPDLAALLVVQMEVLAELTGEMGREGEAADWKRRADDLFVALMRELWRGDRFVARLMDGTPVESQSLIPWLPILLGDRLPADARACLRRGIEGHLTDWGLATERVDSPAYRSNGYWQGPIWAPSTYIAVAGLRRCGFDDLADEIAARFRRLCRTSGFAENFDALTGAPLCDPAYTWTASVFLLLAEQRSGERSRQARPPAPPRPKRRAAAAESDRSDESDPSDPSDTPKRRKRDNKP